MKTGIRLKIDVSKIDKALLFKGEKGVYLDATVFVDMDNADQYGNNGMITQDASKQDRDAGKNGPILGNCKVFWKGDAQPRGNQGAQQHSNHRTAPSQRPADFDDFDQDIPF